MLVDCVSMVNDGAGQVVLLEAPPGVGKSRMLQALKDAPIAQDSSWWSCGGSSYGGDTPLLPIVELVETTAGIQRDDSVDVKRAKVGAWVSTFGPSLSQAFPLIARLLAIPLQEGYTAPQITPQREKALVLDALMSILQASARERSVILVVEDLHWVDPSTLEFLSLVIERAPELRVLLVLTCRPTFRPPWGEPAYLHHVKLDRLSDEQAESLARRVAGDRALPSSVLAQIVEKTDGVPLFVEELTKMVVESGQLQVEDGRYVLSGPLSGLQIPTTLQDSLMARLDRLQHLKALAQFASVLGREFSYEMLHDVRDDSSSPSSVEDQLRHLVDAGLLVQQGVLPKATFTFKHALIQDVAYNSLLKSTRRRHHEQVARALERSFPATVETRPELVAHHFTEAGFDDVAVGYWKRAGELTFSRSANLEAINHLQKALTLLARLPEGMERDRRELELQTLLGPALNTTRGYASPDVERAFGRAHHLCERLGETPELFWTVRGQWTFYLVRGDLGRALDLGEQLLRVAQRQPDATLLLEAHYTLAIVAFWTGALSESLEHFEEALRVDSVSDHRAGVRYTGQHTGVVLLAALAWLRWVQGYPDEALRYSDAAIARAGELSHPLSVTVALYFSIWVHQLRGETDAMARRAREVIAHSREQGLFYDLLANLFVGWALARGDSPAATDSRASEEGIRLIRQCLDMNRASGARLAHTYYLSLLIDIDVRDGRLDDARQVLDDAVATANDTGEAFWLAELYRLEGQMELQRGGQGDDHRRRAAASFTKALDVACRQGARSLELRAAISLARLGGSPDERMAARRRLSAAYGAFTEGAETADLATARMLLAERA